MSASKLVFNIVVSSSSSFAKCWATIDFEILEIAYQAAQNLGVTHQVVQDLGVKTSVFKVIDLASMSATLDRFYEGYIDSRISENDSQEERKKYSNDYFDFKRLLKSIPDDQD